ncbi:MAG: hypothetical protein JST30_06735 [Armatimonadetes bacterium]|nr:hypothetical protein [Armatimonadota bacterium]
MIDSTTVRLLASMAALDRIQRQVASSLALAGHDNGGVILETCQALVEVGEAVVEHTFDEEV